MTARKRAWHDWSGPVARRPRKVAAAAKKAKAKAPARQVFLDFGQREFDSRSCRRCGMLFAPGVTADEAAHKRFCAAQRRTMRVELRSEAERALVVSAGAADAAGERVVLVRGGERCPARKLAARILEIKRREADVSMGFVEEHGEGRELRDSGRSLFALLTSASELAGLLIVERLRSPALRKATAAQVARGEPLEPLEDVGVVLGVRQVWVADGQRRRGVAARLLDAAREHAIFGFVVPREGLAFSQPTAQGAALAESYSRRGWFAVYELGARVPSQGAL